MMFLAGLLGLVLVVGATTAAGVGPFAGAARGGDNTAVASAVGSGAIVIAWNQELLRIVKTPGALPVRGPPSGARCRSPARMRKWARQRVDARGFTPTPVGTALDESYSKVQKAGAGSQ
jgi:hypothetical protein